jgi:hypothetical protein
LLLPLGDSAGVCAANSLLTCGALDALDAGVLHPQFHTSLHWQGFSKEATASKTRDRSESTRQKPEYGTYLSGVGELGQSVSH